MKDFFVLGIRRLNNFQAEGWSLTFRWPKVLLIGGEGGGVGASAESGGAGARILKYSILSAICANVGLSSGSYFIV